MTQPRTSKSLDFCAIDFGTSNSAIAYASSEGMKLAAIESEFETMPTAIFYSAEDGSRRFGRDAIAFDVEGNEGRLMRSIKSILGTDLMNEATEIAPGFSTLYLDVIAGYVQHLRNKGQTQARRVLNRALIGRPVFFVDGDTERDAQAESALAMAAEGAGFTDVRFEYEPLAAAFDYESGIAEEQIILVADIGGGTSDFSVLNVGPKQRLKLNRKSDILANFGVHIAGTDFDREINLSAIAPLLGYKSSTPEGRQVPSPLYFDLATWHRINMLYTRKHLHDFKMMKPMYADVTAYDRVQTVLDHKLGHQLAVAAEKINIDVSMNGSAQVNLGLIEKNLATQFNSAQQQVAITANVEKIRRCAQETITKAQVDPAKINAVYFTGGSTALQSLAHTIAAVCPNAKPIVGNRFSSVVTGLGIAAQRRWG